MSEWWFISLNANSHAILILSTWSRDVSYITNVIETSPKFIGEKRNVQV